MEKITQSELHKYYSSIVNIRAVKRRTRSIRHLTLGREMRNKYKTAVRKPEAKKHLRHQGVDTLIKLKGILKWDIRSWIGLIWLRI